MIATGGQGGVYYVYGHGIAGAVRAELPGMRPQVMATAASLDNLRLLAARKADVAFTLADSAALAVRGQSPFSAPQQIRALALLYDNYVHLVVRAGTAIRSLTDLRGRQVSVGASGSGTELIANRLVDLAGLSGAITRRRLGIAESAAALRAGQVDAFFFSGGLPTAAIADLARTDAIRLVDLSAYVASMRGRYGEFYFERSIPASTYGLGGETATIGVPNLLVVRADMDDDLAFRLTRLLFTERAALARAHPAARRLNARTGYATYPVELHPGAARYYRDTKSA
jgi:uncharacterized protein